MSISVDRVSNNAYDYAYLTHSDTRSQANLNEFEIEGKDSVMVVVWITMLKWTSSIYLDCRKKQESIRLTSMY